MEVIKEADFRKELKANPRAGYLFFGDEDYLKAFAVKQARELICPDPTFAFFNEIRLDAMDFEAQKLVDALMPLPMMADKKLIILSGLNFNTMKPNEVDDLCDALSALKDYDYNMLIVSVAADHLNVGRSPKSPSAIFKKLAEYLTPVQFDRCSTAKLAAWVQKHFLHNGIEAAPALCTRIPEYCGHSMYILANEIDKLSFYLRYHGKTVADEESMRLVCTPLNEYDTYAFTNAIMAGRSQEALAILADYRFRRADPIQILGEVAGTICDMLAVQAMTAQGATVSEISVALNPKKPVHDFRVGLYQQSLRQTSEKRLRAALELCVEADRALKLSPQGYTALEQFICKF